MNREIKPGEWQTEVNQWGGTRRFRMVDGVKEYEAIIKTTNGEFTESQIEKGLHKVKTKAPEIKTEAYYCPFRSGTRMLCKKDCAFWSEAGCMQVDDTTTGKKCPISLYPCDRSCKLYDNGCCFFLSRKRGNKHE